MKVVEDAFTIIHIRISSLKFLGISARHWVTSFLIVILIFNCIKLFTAIFAHNINILGFIEAALLIILNTYISLMWIVAWPKAGKMLNKAVDYEKEFRHIDKK